MHYLGAICMDKVADLPDYSAWGCKKPTGLMGSVQDRHFMHENSYRVGANQSLAFLVLDFDCDRMLASIDVG